MKKLLTIAILLAALPIVGGCNSDDDPPPGDPPPVAREVSEEVEDEDGAALTLDLEAEGSASAQIQPFALSTDAEVTLAALAEDATEISGFVQVGRTIELSGVGLMGLTVVLSGATIEVPYDTEMAVGSEVILMAQFGSEEPEEVTGAVALDGTITANVGGFGTFWAVIEVALELIVTETHPESGSENGGSQVSISGEGFLAGDVLVDFGEQAAIDVQVISDIEIICTAPAGSEGSVDISVTIDDETAVLVDGFLYLDAQLSISLTGSSPSSGPSNGGTQVTINGEGFLSGSMDVDFGADAAIDVQVVSDFVITCTAPGGAEGSVDITVTGNGQTSVLFDAFTYLEAVINIVVSDVNPETGSETLGAAVTITGQGFAQAEGGEVVVVEFGSNTATNVQVLSDGTITCLAPAGTGTVDVTVLIMSGTNVVAEGTLQGAFTYE